jgi:hypothetical protein
MYNDLRIERDRLALEAGLSLDLNGLLKNTFPNIVQGFTALKGRFAPDDTAFQLPAHQQDFMTELGKHSYLDISPLAAFVPEGLKVSYLEYSEVLTRAAVHASGTSVDTINKFAVFLAQLVSNADAKLTTTSMRRELTVAENERNDINKALGKCFGLGSTRTEVTYSDVVARNKDWVAVFKASEALVKLMSSVDRKTLNKKIDECVQLLGIITNKINRGELAGVSPQVVTNLSDGAYAVAQEMEFFAAIYYKTLAYSQCVNRTMDNFRKVFKK